MKSKKISQNLLFILRFHMKKSESNVKPKTVKWTHINMHQQTGKVKANLKRTCFNEDDGERSRGEKI